MMNFRHAILSGAALSTLTWAVAQEAAPEVSPSPLPAVGSAPPDSAVPVVAKPSTPGPARTPVFGRLLIAPCTTPVPLGKATLLLSGLVRKSAVYTGEYQIKVAPLAFGSEKGRVAVAFSDDSLRKLAQRQPVKFNGTGTTTGTGKTRAVDGIATPTARNEGKIQMWFTADGRKKGFASTYRFAE